ncbi:MULTISPECIES: hypothetical protein [Frankia]|uniref:hypothetical protein n=1 Tax=Frankia TaxID=1854 RepID=UPI0005A52F3E|nr:MULTISPECIES: hypothetical protein [Frankia]
MPDPENEWELADVREIGLDQLRDSADQKLQVGVRRLVDTLSLDVPARNSVGNSCPPIRRQDY